MAEVTLLARWVLAGVFALAAVANFGVPERLVQAVAFLLPVVELLLATLLVPASSAGLGAAGARPHCGSSDKPCKGGVPPECKCQ
jgi:hypothetical protein